MTPLPLPLPQGYAERLAFVVELAEQLHAYGTTAQRLEGALNAVASALHLECEPWSNPTGLILTFSDPDGNGWILQEVTTRLPGRIDSGLTSFGSARDLASAGFAVWSGGALGIGVDSNQNGLHPGKVLTSMLKRVDVATDVVTRSKVPIPRP